MNQSTCEQQNRNLAPFASNMPSNQCVTLPESLGDTKETEYGVAVLTRARTNKFAMSAITPIVT